MKQQQVIVMFDFQHQPSGVQQWHAFVHEAETRSEYYFEDTLKHYLALTLNHFMTEDFTDSIIAIEFLESLETPGRLGSNRVREVGDQCLLLSGLFPEQASHRNVSLEYFIGIGQQAYITIANKHPTFYDTELFSQLSFHFVGLMDLLTIMRSFDNKYFN